MTKNVDDNKSIDTTDHLHHQFKERDIEVSHLFAEDVTFNGFDTKTDLEKQNTIEELLAQLEEYDAEKRYTIQDKINSGGMKDIWCAEDLHTLRSIAIAVLKDDKVISEDKKESFIREARLTANLQHPNIVPIYDVSVDSNAAPYFTMKELKGKTLEKVVHKTINSDNKAAKYFTRMDFISIFQKVCDAIAYAHSRGVVHLDLKPSNIIICDYGEVQVIDWGISQFISDVAVEQNHSLLDMLDGNEVTSTQTLIKVAAITKEAAETENNNRLAGSPGYMAPEQISGVPTGLDHRTDIYLLGGILYYILCGKPPVSGGTIDTVMENTLNGTIKLLDSKKVSPALQAITMKALSLNKDDRYASVEEMQQDLRNYIDGFATIAESTSFFKPLLLLIRRNKILVSVIAACFITVIAIMSLSIISINNQKTIAQQHLNDLQKKSDYIVSLTKEVAPMCVASAERSYHRNKFRSFKKRFTMGLAFDPTLEQAQHFQLHTYIAEQKFNKAKEFIRSQPTPALLNWSSYSFFELFAAEKDDDQKLTDYDDILSYLTKIREFSAPHYLRFALHEMNQRPFTPHQQFELIRKLLLEFNPGVKKLNFSYKKIRGGWEIDLSNNPNLTTAIPLAGLRIAVFRAENTNLKALDFFTKWGLRELHCAHSPIDTIIGRAFLKKCSVIDFRGTRYENTNSLYILEKLEKLDLRGRDIEALPQIKRPAPVHIYIDHFKQETIHKTMLHELKKLGYIITVSNADEINPRNN